MRTPSSLALSRPPILWSDSKCVINWYYSRKLLPTFIRNRITFIKNQHISELRYVPSAQNPADLLTKSHTEEDINYTWWKGPPWLQQSEEAWPTKFVDLQTPEEEMENEVAALAPVNDPKPPFELRHEDYSCLPKLWRSRYYNARTISSERTTRRPTQMNK